MYPPEAEVVIPLTPEIALQTLAAYPGILAERITPLPAISRCEIAGIFPYLALLRAEIARFTPRHSSIFIKVGGASSL